MDPALGQGPRLTGPLGERPEVLAGCGWYLLGADRSRRAGTRVILKPNELGYPGRDVPGALDGQDRDDAGNPAQVAGGQGPGQDGDAFGGADGAEHPAAVGVLGVPSPTLVTRAKIIRARSTR